MYKPWVEKYKPTTFDSFKINNNLLKNFDINNYDFNHCIIYGKAGSGKTSFVNLLAKKLYKKEDLHYCLLSLNASDERGINTVREKIKSFAKQSNYKNYKFKMIMLDEADSLTYEAQTALRRIIELYSNNTRFFFICNYDNKIIEPIKSRCNLIKFNNFSMDYIKNHLNYILEKENFNKKDYEKYINIILNITKNDIRKSIIYIESITKINIKYLNEDMIYNIFGILNKKMLLQILDKIKKIEDIPELLSLFNSFSMNNISSLFLEIILDLNINENKKYKFLILLSEVDNIKNKDINYDMIMLKLLKEYYLLIN